MAKKMAKSRIKRKAIGKKAKTSKKPMAKSQGSSQASQQLIQPRPFPTNECPVCGSRNVHYNRERAELICRECGEIHAQIV